MGVGVGVGVWCVCVCVCVCRGVCVCGGCGCGCGCGCVCRGVCVCGGCGCGCGCGCGWGSCASPLRRTRLLASLSPAHTGHDPSPHTASSTASSTATPTAATPTAATALLGVRRRARHYPRGDGRVGRRARAHRARVQGKRQEGQSLPLCRLSLSISRLSLSTPSPSPRRSVHTASACTHTKPHLRLPWPVDGCWPRCI